MNDLYRTALDDEECARRLARVYEIVDTDESTLKFLNEHAKRFQTSDVSSATVSTSNRSDPESWNHVLSSPHPAGAKGVYLTYGDNMSRLADCLEAAKKEATDKKTAKDAHAARATETRTA